VDSDLIGGWCAWWLCSDVVKKLAALISSVVIMNLSFFCSMIVFGADVVVVLCMLSRYCIPTIHFYIIVVIVDR